MLPVSLMELKVLTSSQSTIQWQELISVMDDSRMYKTRDGIVVNRLKDNQ
jgi:hypothetical protein